MIKSDKELIDSLPSLYGNMIKDKIFRRNFIKAAMKQGLEVNKYWLKKSERERAGT